MTQGETSKFPTTTGDPLDQWVDGANLKTNNGAFSYEGTPGEAEDTSVYNFHIPADAIIQSIIVEVEGAFFTIL